MMLSWSFSILLDVDLAAVGDTALALRFNGRLVRELTLIESNASLAFSVKEEIVRAPVRGRIIVVPEGGGFIIVAYISRDDLLAALGRFACERAILTVDLRFDAELKLDEIVVRSPADDIMYFRMAPLCNASEGCEVRVDDMLLRLMPLSVRSVTFIVDLPESAKVLGCEPRPSRFHPELEFQLKCPY